MWKFLIILCFNLLREAHRDRGGNMHKKNIIALCVIIVLSFSAGIVFLLSNKTDTGKGEEKSTVNLTQNKEPQPQPESTGDSKPVRKNEVVSKKELNVKN